MLRMFSGKSNQMPVEAKQEILRLLDEHVSHIVVEKGDSVAFHPADEKSAGLLIDALNRDSRITLGKAKISLKHQDCHPKLTGKKCHVIRLSAPQFDVVFGEGHFKILREFNDKYYKSRVSEIVSVTGQLVDIAESHRELYQLIIRLIDASGAWWPFQDVLRHQTADICNVLIEHATTAALHQVMRTQDLNGWCGLKLALRCQLPDVCHKLINRLDNSVLDQVLILQDKEQCNAFANVFSYQSFEICVSLVGRATEKVLNQALLILDSYGWPLIMKAAWFQPGSVIAAIISKISSEDLARAVCMRHAKDNDSTFEVAAQYHTHATVQQLLHHVSAMQAKEMINEFFSKFTDNLIKTFRLFALYQSLENMSLFLILLDSKQQEILFSHCEKNINTSEIRFVLRALKWKLSRSSVTSSLINTLLKPLTRLDEERLGKIKEEKRIFIEAQSEQDALKKIQQGAFVKIIRHDEKKDNHEEFINHLAKPENRHAIRKKEGQDKQGYKALLRPGLKEEKEGKSHIGYTFPGGFPSIVKARTPEERKQHKLKKQEKRQGKPCTQSTKHPATFVSNRLHTALFGYRADRDMVGYAFTVNEDNIRLLLVQDSGTYKRWWYGEDLNALFGDIGHRANIICQTFADFVKRVDEQPYVVNEVLVKLGLQDIFAIIIARDTLTARKIAVQHKLEHYQRFQNELPILFYDPEYSHVGIYTATEQRRNFPELFFAELKRQLNHFVNLTPRGFFAQIAKINIHIDYQNYSINIESARKIYDIITKHDKAPNLAFAEIRSVVSSSSHIALKTQHKC